jgi:hypothetical protein
MQEQLPRTRVKQDYKYIPFIPPSFRRGMDKGQGDGRLGHKQRILVWQEYG